jgi:IS5 family transposase
MFKILILQAWYALSDEALEKQIARDLMFRRFIDLSLFRLPSAAILTL